MKLKEKVKQKFCRCTLVEDLYPENEGNYRIVFCINCGKLHLINANEKKIFSPEEHNKVYILKNKEKQNGTK